MMMFAGVLVLGGHAAQAQDARALATVPAPSYSFAPGSNFGIFAPATSNLPRRIFSAAPTMQASRVSRQYDPTDPTGRNSTLAKPWLRPLP